MTVSIGLFEAKMHLAELVDQVATSGEEVIITRRGRPIARLVPMEEHSAIEEALALLAAARAASRPGPESIRELIDEGRRW